MDLVLRIDLLVLMLLRSSSMEEQRKNVVTLEKCPYAPNNKFQWKADERRVSKQVR